MLLGGEGRITSAQEHKKLAKTQLNGVEQSSHLMPTNTLCFSLPACQGQLSSKHLSRKKHNTQLYKGIKDLARVAWLF